jgi:TolB-like protein/Flp pilus assembly protein TadD
MPTEPTTDPKFDIGHILFIDIVGYSKLNIDEQSRLLRELNKTVQGTEQFRRAEVENKLMRLPTGDGMALIFRDSAESPAQSALEISKALRTQGQIPVRMGIHSGPVNEVNDVNNRTNLAGAGINMAQRVMDCGDADHILLSRHIAEDLENYARWQPLLHDLGECEVKHGVRIPIVNLYSKAFGNPNLPNKLRQSRDQDAITLLRKRKQQRQRNGMLIAVSVLLVFALAVVLFLYRRGPEIITDNSAIPFKSIAVLPFENLSANPENAFFADGVQDEILTDLAKIADLKVISRTSVMSYKTGAARNVREIGKQLGVVHVLEGSVQRAGDKVRVSAQLVDTRSDAHLWAQTYDRDLADVFAIQSEIAEAIAGQLQAKLSPRQKAAIEQPPTTDFEAYDLYLRAQVLFADVSNAVYAKEKLPKAAQLLEQATTRDPRFVLAWCLLSNVHGIMYWEGLDRTPERLNFAHAAVETALRLQPDAGEPHLALASYYYQAFRDYDAAAKELELARRTLPNNAEVLEYTGYIDRRQGRWDQATRNLERAVELDPQNFRVLQQLALTYQPQRRYNEQLRTYDRALKIVPGDPLTRVVRAALAVDWRADIRPYQETLAAVIAEDPAVAPDVDDPNYALCERSNAAAERTLKDYPHDGESFNGVLYPHAYWEGVVARWQGDGVKARSAFAAARAELEKMLEKQPDFPAALSLLGIVDAGLGRTEEALSEGRRACELVPVSRDSFDGVAFLVNLAQIYTWIGDKDRAITQIAEIERVPNLLSYGFLKLQPFWDPLRGDPRFEKLVASLAPKH